MPLFSEHLSNMYYGGSPSYSSPYSSYTSSFSPLGTSYSASYLNPGGNYSSHSSISSYSRAPLTSRWTPGLSRNYSPMLTPISERSTSSPVRINSPRRIPISKRSYRTSGYTQRPININTADIDVSKDKYRRKSIETPTIPYKPPLQKEPSVDDKEKSPFMSRVDGKPETGIDSSPGDRSTIKRGRTVVRLHTVKRRERESPRKPLETAEPQDIIQNALIESSAVVFEDDTLTKTKNWREKLSGDLIYPEKREKKSLGTKFVETHLVKNVDQADAKTSSNHLRNDIKAEGPPTTLQPYNELAMICKSPDRRCSMELLAEQASVLDALIKGENLSTAPLDLSKVGVTEDEPKNLGESIKRKKSKENPLKTTKSDQSLHENLKTLRNSKDSKSFSKRRSLKKSFSGGSISRLDSITEFPKDPIQTELPAIEEIRTSIKINKADEKPKPKPKTKITASVEITPPTSPLKFKIENVTVEEKVHTPKKEIFFTSTVEDSTTHAITPQKSLKKTKERRSDKRKTKNVSDPQSPEPEDGNFWDKIGKRETVYLMKRKQNLDEIKEKHTRALFWFPENGDAEIPDIIENSSSINSSKETSNDFNNFSEAIVTKEHESSHKEIGDSFSEILKSENNNTSNVKIDSQQILSQNEPQHERKDRLNENDLNVTKDSKNTSSLHDFEMNSDIKSMPKHTSENNESEGKISLSDDTKQTNNDLNDNINKGVYLKSVSSEEILPYLANIQMKCDMIHSVDASSLQDKKNISGQNFYTDASQNKDVNGNSTASKHTPTKTESHLTSNSEKTSIKITDPPHEDTQLHLQENTDKDTDTTNKEIYGTPVRKKLISPTKNTEMKNITTAKSQEKSEILKGNDKVHTEVSDKKKVLGNNMEKTNSPLNTEMIADDVSAKPQEKCLFILQNSKNELRTKPIQKSLSLNDKHVDTAKKDIKDARENVSLSLNSSLSTITKSKVASAKAREESIPNIQEPKIDSTTKPIQMPISSNDKKTDSASPAADTMPNVAKDNASKKLKPAKKSDPKILNKKEMVHTSPKLIDNKTVQICPIHGVLNKTDASSAAIATTSEEPKPSTSMNQPAEIASEVPVDLLTKTDGESAPPTTVISNIASPNDIPSTTVPQIPIEIQSENIPKISPQSDSEKVQNELKPEERTKEEPNTDVKLEEANQTKQLSTERKSPASTPIPKRLVKEEKALKPLIATPRPLLKRVPQIIHSSDSSDSSSDEDSSEEESDDSEDSTEFFECENNADGRTSTGSNDSGFDSSAPTSPASFMHIKKDCDVNCHRKCEKLTANLCGVNQRLLVEALATRTASKKGADSPGPSSSNATSQLPATDISEQELEQSTAYGIFRKTGRFTPPARSIPRFRKYTIEDFHFIKVLGKGSFGKVLLAELRDTEYYYAVKCLKKDVVLEDDDVECTLIERKVLALGTNHPYLCHLFATFQTDSHLFFVMEYLNGGDLMFHIQQSGRFPETRARFYAAEIVSGLKFLHKRGIVYRDLKLDNILLDFDGHVRIADFGMCKLQIYLEKTADTFCGTPDYMAPEIIKGLKYNQAVDWWSFGVLLYEMLIGQSPFSGCDEDELFWSICNEMPSYPRFLSQEALTILTRLLDKDARTRLGSAECMHGDVREQEFFHAVHWERLERRDLEAPFRPRVRHPLDTQYFDRAFTGERPRLTAVEPHVLRSMDQEPFRGFSYTNPNATDR